MTQRGGARRASFNFCGYKTVEMKKKVLQEGGNDSGEDASNRRASTRSKRNRKKQTGPVPVPEDCQEFAKDQVAEAWPAIVEGFVKQAKQGSYNHTKFIVEFSGLKEAAQKSKRKGSGASLAKLLMKELKKGSGGKESTQTAKANDQQGAAELQKDCASQDQALR